MHERWVCNKIGVDDDACHSYIETRCRRKFITKMIKGIRNGQFGDIFIPNIYDKNISNEHSIWCTEYGAKNVMTLYNSEEIYGRRWFAKGSVSTVPIESQYDLIRYSTGHYFLNIPKEKSTIEFLQRRQEIYVSWWSNDPSKKELVKEYQDAHLPDIITSFGNIFTDPKSTELIANEL